MTTPANDARATLDRIRAELDPSLSFIDVRKNRQKWTPALLAAVTAALDVHQPDWNEFRTAADVHCRGCSMPGVSFVYYKDCKTVRAVMGALDSVAQ